MKTYQDLIKNEPSSFLTLAIGEYKASEMYKNAVYGVNYSTGKNTVITNFQKLLYTLSGEAVPDNYSANHKCQSGFLQRLTCQQSSYLLANGVQFEEEETKNRIDANFDSKLLLCGQNALIQGVVYGFYNYDHIDYFNATEFVPLYDEETGALRAGIRFWQIAIDKPMRITLFEEDGFTEYVVRNGKTIVLQEKRTYIVKAKSSKADGVIIVDGQNYDGFPIVPLYANQYKQSELVPIKSKIDAYDLIASGSANDLDEATLYWTLENCGGMTDIDVAKFRDRLKTIKVASVDGDDGAKATAHTIEIPYQAREFYLNKLEKDIVKDYMGLDTELLSAGNITATQIKAAYEPMSEKADRFEAQVITHILGLLKLAGIDDYPKFRRSQTSNELEQTQMVMQCANVLDVQTILEHLPFLTVDEIPVILERMQKEEMERVQNSEQEEQEDKE